MRITLNGEAVEFEGDTVSDVVDRLVKDARLGVAVAVNGEVVAKSGWRKATLRDGDNVEVLRAIGGG
jgi:sulfur carrier protein